MPQGLKRIPSANWRTENLEDLWAQSEPLQSAEYDGSLHEFLDYCCLLRNIRKQFEVDTQAGGFDACAFFLRGGYFAFKYLNMTTSMALRATIFGGLNHGRHPKLELPEFMDELHEKVVTSGKHHAELLIVDEVKSGTGMGTILNLIMESMNKWSSLSECEINIRFYAIRPGLSDEKSSELEAAEKKWHGEHSTNGGLLTVDIKDFVGPLLGYDSDRLCGVRRVSRSADQSEAYEIFKSVGGTIRLSCDSTRESVFEASIGRGSLVESLSAYSVALTCNSSSAVSNNLAQRIDSVGCPVCRELYLGASEQ